MAWAAQLRARTSQCPCGDLVSTTPAELAQGETIARCPSCSLFVEVIYDPDRLPVPPTAGEESGDDKDGKGGEGKGEKESAGPAEQQQPPPAPAQIPAAA